MISWLEPTIVGEALFTASSASYIRISNRSSFSHEATTSRSEEATAAYYSYNATGSTTSIVYESGSTSRKTQSGSPESITEIEFGIFDEEYGTTAATRFVQTSTTQSVEQLFTTGTTTFEIEDTQFTSTTAAQWFSTDPSWTFSNTSTDYEDVVGRLVTTTTTTQSTTELTETQIANTANTVYQADSSEVIVYVKPSESAARTGTFLTEWNEVGIHAGAFITTATRFTASARVKVQNVFVANFDTVFDEEGTPEVVGPAEQTAVFGGGYLQTLSFNSTSLTPTTHTFVTFEKTNQIYGQVYRTGILPNETTSFTAFSRAVATQTQTFNADAPSFQFTHYGNTTTQVSTRRVFSTDTHILQNGASYSSLGRKVIYANDADGEFFDFIPEGASVWTATVTYASAQAGTMFDNVAFTSTTTNNRTTSNYTESGATITGGGSSTVVDATPHFRLIYNSSGSQFVAGSVVKKYGPIESSNALYYSITGTTISGDIYAYYQRNPDYAKMGPQARPQLFLSTQSNESWTVSGTNVSYKLTQLSGTKIITTTASETVSLFSIPSAFSSYLASVVATKSILDGQIEEGGTLYQWAAPGVYFTDSAENMNGALVGLTAALDGFCTSYALPDDPPPSQAWQPRPAFFLTMVENSSINGMITTIPRSPTLTDGQFGFSVVGSTVTA